MKIIKISAREVLDSRGNPTVAATCELESGAVAEASVPSGASTGENESVELRDGGKRYEGRGVLTAVENVNTVISKNLKGMDASDQKLIDERMILLDGTEDKSKLGANAILSVSLACARAAATAREIELYEHIHHLNGWDGEKYKLPTPMFNILNGGKHAKNNVDIQETMIVPVGPKKFKEKLRVGTEIYHTLKSNLVSDGYSVGLGDEGGFAPSFDSNDKVFSYVEKSISNSGYSNKQVRISIDAAADSFYNKKRKEYVLDGGKKKYDSKKMITQMARWAKRYNFLSIEDGLFEADENWELLTKKIRPTFSIGDDLFVTDPQRIQKGALRELANGVIIKPNQIGTLTETIEAIKVAKRAKMKVIVSHRSGDTADSFIADLTVACGADYIKSGAPARSERLAKYNRLLKIEEDIERRNNNE